MSDKPVAGLVAVAAIAPLCAVCIVGTSGLASIFAWFLGWFGGFDWVVVTAFALIVGIFVYALFRRRTTSKQMAAHSEPMNRSVR